jgi:hypothetical protein
MIAAWWSRLLEFKKATVKRDDSVRSPDSPRCRCGLSKSRRAYPSGCSISAAAQALWWHGDSRSAESAVVAVVGTRRATQYGRE